MRIISKFRDYYDCVQAQGQDEDLVWIRKKEKFFIQDWPFPKLTPFLFGYSVHRSRLYFDMSIVGFCGKIYPLIRASDGNSQHKICNCYNIDEIDEFIKSYLRPKDLSPYMRGKPYGKKWSVCARRSGFKEFFHKCEQEKGLFDDLFRLKNAPIFIARYKPSKRGYEIEYNSRLKTINFYRLFDTYTAFQEISMYVGGVLGNVNEKIPPIDDKTMAEAKGFDKWSFRRMPK